MKKFKKALTLYTITVYARDVNPDYYSWSTQVHHTYTVRCY